MIALIPFSHCMASVYAVPLTPACGPMRCPQYGVVVLRPKLSYRQSHTCNGKGCGKDIAAM